jgi:hypothetical protein
MVDSGQAPANLFTFILRVDSMPDAARLIEPAEAMRAIAEAAIDLTPYYAMPAVVAQERIKNLRKVIAHEADPMRGGRRGETGGCWLWLHDNTSELVRALVVSGGITISREGRYLVDLPKFDSSLDLRVRENATDRIAKAVEKMLGTAASRYSVLGSYDPDGLPSYTEGFGAWEAVHANYAHDPDDF